MNSLTIPDINVWLAIIRADHIHRAQAREWWESDESDTIGFTRITQIGTLRLLTTAAAMNNQPLTMSSAWSLYDRLFEDERVTFLNEPRGVEEQFRANTLEKQSSPKVWADAWLISFARKTGGQLVTFDRALGSKYRNSLVLG